jgi:hypothetical protein
MIIKTVAREKGKKFEARKYAEVPSVTNEAQRYIVTKFRVRGKNYYHYQCTCPHQIFRQPRGGCKHIRAFKELEQFKGRINRITKT